MKNLKHIFIPLITISALFIAFHLFIGKERFPENAENAILKVKDSVPFLSEHELNESETDFVVVVLDERMDSGIPNLKRMLHIPFDQLLHDKNRQLLEEQNGKIILSSIQAGTAARAWTILNQLGFQDAGILLLDETEEIFNYTFQPDTTINSEFSER